VPKNQQQPIETTGPKILGDPREPARIQAKGKKPFSVSSIPASSAFFRTLDGHHHDFPFFIPFILLLFLIEVILKSKEFIKKKNNIKNKKGDPPSALNRQAPRAKNLVTRPQLIFTPRSIST
jgi:hypothetical protein